jgi:hypothetical protein
MRRANRQRIAIAGAGLAVVLAGWVWWVFSAADPTTAIASVPQGTVAPARTEGAPPPAGLPPPVDALGPDPARVARRVVPELPPSLGALAAEEYRRRARFPEWSEPLAAEDEDPILRDRAVSRVSSRGRNGEDPALTVYPARISFEAPEAVVLHAYLAVNDRPVPVLALRGTLLTEDLLPLAEFDYADDGSGGDAVAGDDVYTATLLLSPDLTPELSASYLVKVRAFTTSEEERLAATSFQYASPHSHLTGRYRDRMVDGSLAVDAEVEVHREGRFHLEATLYTRDGGAKLSRAQTAGVLPPGVHWMTLPFYGLALRERGIDGPYLLRFVALSTTTAMPNAKNRLVENAMVTRAYPASSFTDRSFDDPDLLEAADRIERDDMPAGLDAEG